MAKEGETKVDLQLEKSIVDLKELIARNDD